MVPDIAQERISFTNVSENALARLRRRSTNYPRSQNGLIVHDLRGNTIVCYGRNGPGGPSYIGRYSELDFVGVPGYPIPLEAAVAFLRPVSASYILCLVPSSLYRLRAIAGGDKSFAGHGVSDSRGCRGM